MNQSILSVRVSSDDKKEELQKPSLGCNIKWKA